MRDRARSDRHLGNFEELAVVGETLVAQRLDDDSGGFDETRARFLHRDAEAIVFHRRGAAAEAEDGAPAREHVEHRDFLGDAYRVVPRQHDDGSAEHDPPGARGEVGQQLNHVGHHRVSGEMMFDAPDRVEPQRLGEIAKHQVVAVNLIVGLVADVKHRYGGANFHACTLRIWINFERFDASRSRGRPYRSETAISSPVARTTDGYISISSTTKK